MDIYDLISLRVFIFFPVRDWNQYSFHLHYLQWKSLIAKHLILKAIIIIYALDTQTNLKIHTSEMGMIRIRLTQ